MSIALKVLEYELKQSLSKVENLGIRTKSLILKQQLKNLNKQLDSNT